MDHMTIGQRIAAKRKEPGMSQSDLGEKMGVSRQAISKWESDAAIPDIDKLIALSKLFGVSVGWLLGVEEPAEQAGDAFTEEQLRLLEKVVQRQPALPRWQKLAALAMACIITLCSTTALFVAMRADRRIDAQSEAIETAPQEMSQTLRVEAPDLLTDYSFSAAMGRYGNVAVTFTGTPNGWNPHDRGCLLLYKGGELSRQEDAFWNGTTLTATVNTGVHTDCKYVFQVTQPDGTELRQTLRATGCEDIHASMNFFIEGGIHRWHQEGSTLILDDFNLAVQYPIIQPEGEECPWVRVDVVLIHEFGSLQNEVWCKSLAELLAEREYPELTQPATAEEMNRWNILRPVLAPILGYYLIELPIPEMEHGDHLRLELRCVYEYRNGHGNVWDTSLSYPLLRCTWRNGTLE